jgi:hypothetical protein
MLRIHRRDLGALILLGFLVTIASVPVAHAYTSSGGNTGQAPIDPQFGAGGGGPGGNGWSDPDELGIYTRPVPQTPNVSPLTAGSAQGVSVETKAPVDLKIQLYAYLARLIGGLAR